MPALGPIAFTGSNGATIQSLDANWVKVTGFTADGLIISNRVRSSAANALYYYNAAMGSADQEVSADFYIAGTTSTTVTAWIFARLLSTEQTGYGARWRRNTGWQIFRYNAGTPTQIGSTAGPTTYTAGTVKAATLRCVGSTISLLVDGTEIINATDGSPLTAAGYAGLLSSNTSTTDGPYLDNWSATETGTAIAGTVASAAATGKTANVSVGSGSISCTVASASASGKTATLSGTTISASLASAAASGKSAAVRHDFQIVANAVWTWFTDPRAVHYNGATYIGSITTAGSIVISKYVHATRTTTSFTLSANLQADDHNNPAIHILPDGRIAAFYCKHNDASGHRYRVSTNPEDISAWGSETLISSGITLPVTYANPRRLSQDPDRLWLFYRAGAGASSDNGLHYKTTTDLSTWGAEVAVWKNVTGGASTPYYKIIDDGVKRFHFAATDKHPVGGQSSVYHWYMELDGSNVPRWYKTDGTEIVSALPHGPSVATLVSDGSTVRRWIWDIAIGKDGYPRILGTRYPNNDGTDIRYMHWRWTGSAWAETEICAAGTGLYSPEIYYAGGMCFDSIDCNRIYLSVPVNGVREIQEWVSSDNGATWGVVLDITGNTASGVLNARPFSPRNHPNDLQVLFWSGTYTTFTNYSTNVHGSIASYVATQINCGAASASAVGRLATVSTGPVVACGTAVANAAGRAANVSQATAIAASVAAASASGNTASVSAGGSIPCSRASASATGRLAGVSAAVNVSAALAVAAASGKTAGVAQYTAVQATRASASATGKLASISAPIVIPAAVAAAVASGKIATIGSGSGGLTLTQADIDAIADAVWAKVIEGALTAEQIQRILLAVNAGDATGLESGAPLFKSQDGTKNRVVATYSAGARVVTSRDAT